jgi:hypothetical protein
MCKKLGLIATLAVVAAVFVIGGKNVCSRIRYWRQQLRTAVEERIPPEQEIARLRMELNNLDRADGRQFETVARQGVQVEKLEQKVKAFEEKVAKEDSRLRAMLRSLDGNSKQVSYNGREYPRDELKKELRLSAPSFQAEEEHLKSLKAQLSAKKQHYELNRGKLMKLKSQRQRC